MQDDLILDFTMPTIKDKSEEVIQSIGKHSDKIGESPLDITVVL